MRKIQTQIAAAILSITMLFGLSGCSSSGTSSSSSSVAESVVSSEPVATETPTPEPTEAPTPAPTAAPATTITLADIPTYSGEPYVAINDNVPLFTDSELTTASFEDYSPLDSLGRCGVAYSWVGL